MSDKGIRMTGYKEVRRTLGTIHYPYQSLRPNLYEAIRTHPQDLEALILDDGGRHKKKKNKHKYQKKVIEIVDKQDKMKDLFLDLATDDGKPDVKYDVKPDVKPDDKPKPIEAKKAEPSSPMTKTIRVSNITADKKKGELVL